MALQVTMQDTVSGTSGFYQAAPSDGLQWVLGNYVLGKSTNGAWFGTFCLETNEYFSPGSTYNVTLNTYASYGGVGGATGNKDYICEATAYLYSQFAAGTLGGGFVYGDSASTGALQNMIWWLEGEIATDQSANLLAPLLTGKYGNLVNAQNSIYSGSDVKVMILTDAAGGRHQDQLVYVGVPDSGLTAVLLGIGLLGLSLVRRRVRMV